MADIDPWDMDEDDPEAPWNKDPVEGMPETITPGRIKVQFWFYLGSDEQMAHDFVFNWGGGKEADWFYDISDDNPGLSVMSSAPFTGTASWKSGTAVETTYFAGDFGFGGKTTVANSAPNDDDLSKPQTWVDLAANIAGYCNGLMMGEIEEDDAEEDDDPELDD